MREIRPAIPGKWTALQSRASKLLFDSRKLTFFQHGWGGSANDCYSDMYIHPPPYKKIYSYEVSIYVRCCCV